MFGDLLFDNDVGQREHMHTKNNESKSDLIPTHYSSNVIISDAVASDSDFVFTLVVCLY